MLKIDGIRNWMDKQGRQQYEVVSLYEREGIDGVWAIAGRWYGTHAPKLNGYVRYIRGQYGFIAFPEAGLTAKE